MQTEQIQPSDSTEPTQPTEKRCPACDTVKPRTDFPVARRRKDGMGSTCRRCISKKYKPDMERIRRNANRTIERNQDWLRNYLAKASCTFCRQSSLDPAQLRLQQTSPRGERGIRYTVFAGLSLKRCAEEAEHCWVICDSCYADRHSLPPEIRDALSNGYAAITDKRTHFAGRAPRRGATQQRRPPPQL